MSNEIQKLQKAFNGQDPIKARKQAKNAAIGAAMEAFDKENSTFRKGNTIETRLKGQGNTTGNSLLKSSPLQNGENR